MPTLGTEEVFTLICVDLSREPRVPGLKSSLLTLSACAVKGGDDGPVSGCCHELGGGVWECPTETWAFWKGMGNLH